MVHFLSGSWSIGLLHGATGESSVVSEKLRRFRFFPVLDERECIQRDFTKHNM